MRYLLITYLRKPDGKIDEQVTVAKRIKPTDIQTCNVIMDFKNKKVEKAHIDGLPMGIEWEKLMAYYYSVYPSILERLIAESGYVEDEPESETPE